MKTITGYLKPYIGRMILGFIVKVLGTFMDLGLPWVLAYMIDEVIPQNSYSLIALWGRSHADSCGRRPSLQCQSQPNGFQSGAGYDCHDSPRSVCAHPEPFWPSTGLFWDSFSNFPYVH